MNGIAYQTTLRGAGAAFEAIAVAKHGDIRVASLQPTPGGSGATW